jgi:hypothetical protein
VRISELESEQAHISTLNVRERIDYTREQRALARFHAAQKHWNSFQARPPTAPLSH